MSRVPVLLALLAALAGTLLWPAGAAERGLVPDFLLLLVLAAGLQGRGHTGVLTGIAAGLLAAPLTLEPFGLDAAVLGLAGLAAARVRGWLRGDHPGVQSALAAAAVLLPGILRLLRMAVGPGEARVGSLLLPLLLAAVATAAAAPVVIPAVGLLGLFREPARRRPALV